MLPPGQEEEENKVINTKLNPDIIKFLVFLLLENISWSIYEMFWFLRGHCRTLLRSPSSQQRLACFIYSAFHKETQNKLQFIHPPNVQPRPPWGKNLLGLLLGEVSKTIQLRLIWSESSVLSPGGEDTRIPIHSESISQCRCHIRDEDGPVAKTWA